MDSPSITDDSLRGYSDSEHLEDYNELEWHDKDCTAPFANPDNPLTSKICNACQSLFSGLKETQRLYKHYYHRSALWITAENGCQLCALVRSKIDRETNNHRPSARSLCKGVARSFGWTFCAGISLAHRRLYAQRGGSLLRPPRTGFQHSYSL